MPNFPHHPLTAVDPLDASSSSPPPPQVLEMILVFCGPRELGSLAATHPYFKQSGITERVARALLRETGPPRLRSLIPAGGETFARLLHFTVRGSPGLCHVARARV